MTQHWTPSRLALALPRAAAWELHLDGEDVVIHLGDAVHRLTLGFDARLTVKRGLLWASVVMQRREGPTITLDGLSHADAGTLSRALDTAEQAQEQRERGPAFLHILDLMRQWNGDAEELLTERRAQRRWIGHDDQQALLDARPPMGLSSTELHALFHDADLPLDDEERESALIELELWEQDWNAACEAVNAQILATERNAARPLLDRVESRPLTDEQAHAVICFDNRVQVVAAAGSGKTSTMVAKAAYAIQRGYAEPRQIVMLAFNKEAAGELQQRTDRAFARLGMGDSVVQARTFHALGLAIIASVTGRRPEVPDWAVDATLGFHRLADLIDQLKDRSHAFRTRWDMFRLVFGRDLPAQGGAMDADGWDKDGSGYVRTLQGERVRSVEDCILADWLFYNGVRYAYDRSQRFDARDEAFHAPPTQFYYPDAGLHHRHGGADTDPLPHTEGRHLDTSSHDLRMGWAFDDLDQALAAGGVVVDPNPDRDIPEEGQKPMPDAELIGLMRTFISHAKSNCLSLDDMAARLREMPDDQFKERYRRFLEIAGPVLQAWDDALDAEHAIDFEDMLNQAAEHLEQGRHASPYTLVMADEFQDASRARARLCRALVQQPGSYFFAVGDDWQSINRFAGADVSVMTRFSEWFGHGQVLRLEQTFRCPQALCDVSSRFISANPAQIRKHVWSSTPSHGPVLQAFQVAARDQLTDAVGQYLQQLHQACLSGAMPAGRDGKLSVFVLGRYNADRAYLPGNWRSRFGATLEVSFLTAHRSKGMEADVVILPALLDRAFPNLRADDDVLSLAMPRGDPFPLGEERRLFYVALTRARRSVAMFTVLGKRSAFLDELERDGAVQVTTLDGKPVKEQRCPACGTGVIVKKTGKYGDFHSCSGYPRCEHKPRLTA
ncbi:UvrD-helicase domain-containing protein [Stenotrophomonas sp. CFBP 13724]|uniref:UvrD-helicase domain-containing protein n=1 Tax=Stenotrophomonas sp. CFBP 13724 TaxID=2775298 RepID=UPI0017860D88|nr:UvrD-helicase domain-containing protein [Stenotrophomonas sp. CFBP 13724]MBD8644208.1 UvrD-helicase domain-containing protein [Stenotrophomonas sp. CFBP 13724]